MCGNAKCFILGALAGMAVLAIVPMSDPVIRSRVERCTKRMIRRARNGIEDLM